MLTGEYDWSNTPAMSQETCDKIAGGKMKAMPSLGHFPMTENPRIFVDYCESRRLLLALACLFGLSLVPSHFTARQASGGGCCGHGLERAG